MDGGHHETLNESASGSQLLVVPRHWDLQEKAALLQAPMRGAEEDGAERTLLNCVQPD